MKDKVLVKAILNEMESWNASDRNRFNQDTGTIDFDGTFCFVARQKKIARLRQLLKVD